MVQGTPTSGFYNDFFDGLSSNPKSIPGKYLWDEAGSNLFIEICNSGAYYPASWEVRLLKRCLPEIAKSAGDRTCVVEFGSGGSQKTRILFEALAGLKRYIPIDISKNILRESANAIAVDYPGLEVLPVCGDFSEQIPKLATEDCGCVLGFFPGNSIGNMDPGSAETILTRIRDALEPALLLIGNDPNRNVDLLQQAYGSSLMAAFHKNVLARAIRELQAELEIEDFEHRICILEEPPCVEAHLIATRPAKIRAGDRAVALAAGECIRTDLSWKYALEDFHALLIRSGWHPIQCWSDPQELYAVHLARSTA